MKTNKDKKGYLFKMLNLIYIDTQLKYQIG